MNESVPAASSAEAVARCQSVLVTPELGFRLTFLVAFASAVLMIETAAAAMDSAEALARYRQERAVCNEGKSNQDLQTCLREANAALQESRQPQAARRPAVDPVNQTKRCDALPAEQARDCIARMNDQGTTTGSVAGGGVLREIVTPTVPASAASAASR